ncbi:CopG family ribbon-helix-helix protein [Halobacteria archaeon AArc-curdl1]|uniref:CopG family ribbon-helix-helix protein n=1 Tax=Natronosalvus hydrolyticus TaxID=2979988 RepID=A0AAP3E8Z9_9EURY|nr:CopG family ribbon-helix-helix protein [Halobacteria archaeon AArc-curdl1]
MPVVSISMPDELLEQLDTFADHHEYTGRSEVVREGARSLLEEFEDSHLETESLAAVITILYEFGCQSVEHEVTGLRHEYEAAIASNTHSHVGSYCLELFVLETNLEGASQFVNEARACSGVETVDYSVLELEEETAIGVQ